MKIVVGIAGLLVLFSLGAGAQTVSIPGGTILSSGGSVCLAPQSLQNFSGLNVVGSATDKLGNAVTVKWTVWAGPTQFPSPIASTFGNRLFKTDAATVFQTVPRDPSTTFQDNLANPWTQACIVNTTTDIIAFFLQQTPQ
jgi:hypothetical protein